MAEKVLSYPVYDIETAVSEGHATEVHEETNKLIRFIFDSETDGKVSPEMLATLIAPQKNAIIASSLKEKRNRQIMFAFGRFTGAVEVLEKFLDFVIKQEQSKKAIVDSDIANIPHIIDIVDSIATHPGIRHGKLAELVGIQKNTLTPIMDKLVDRDLVTFSRPGKYKFYYLTAYGEMYYKENQTQILAANNIDYIIEQLLLVIAHSENPSELVGKIATAVFEGKHKFEGYLSNKTQAIDSQLLVPRLIGSYILMGNPNEEPGLNEGIYHVEDATAVTFNSGTRRLDCFSLSVTNKNVNEFANGGWENI